MRVRPARTADAEAVAAFTENTWERYEGGDYLPRVFPRWAADDDPGQQTFVGELDGQPVGVIRARVLTEQEAWFQGLRVDPDVRGKGYGKELLSSAMDWAAEQGATVGRAMVFSWNVMGLGVTREAGFDRGVEFRWARPDPDVEVSIDGTVETDPDAAWACWQRSAARSALRGLALDRGVSWAASQLTRSDLEGGRTITVNRERTVGMALRTRVTDRDEGSGEARYAEYGAAAWADRAACGDLMGAIARDAANQGADEIRVLVPETHRTLAAVASHRVDLADEPDFVVSADLTGRPN